MRYSKLVVFLTFLTLFGCAPRIVVRIDGIIDPREPIVDKTYILMSDVDGTSADDLYFREYGWYIKDVLAQHGYRYVENEREADIVVYFNYGMSGGEMVHYSYARPIYATLGGETINVTETTTDSAGVQTTTTKTIHVPYRSHVVGVTSELETYTVFTAHAVLEARKIDHEQPLIKDNMKMLWKLIVTTTTKSDDLRHMMPYMVALSSPFVGQDTGQVKVIVVKPDDERVEEMKRRRDAALGGLLENHKN